MGFFNRFRRDASTFASGNRRRRKGFFKLIPTIVTTEQIEAFREAKTVFNTSSATCPDCRSGTLRVDPKNPETRRCDNPRCEFFVSLLGPAAAGHTAPIFAPERKCRQYRRHADFYLILASAIFAAASVYAGLSRSFTPVLGATLVALPLLAAAFAARYRAWQIANVRIFEEQAPIGDFVSSWFSKRNTQ